MMKIRLTKSEDLGDLTVVLKQTALFPSEMLPEMINGFLTDTEDQDIWLSCEVAGKVIGFCYAKREALTDRTWNMLAIAVLPSAQGDGVGSAIVSALENTLRKQGQRVLIVDTSGSDEFLQTRQFYQQNNYTEEARIRDFWAEGDDKIIFWKSL